ncbi:concanavalin A-like lectin/glucanase domain-containing protein [Bisporella sp. PMI_857]|nr:concanavalin A-like lectin/glucanase domain-containing protein [Bisporella sp. PMI_857]
MLWDKVIFWGLAFMGLCIGGYVIYTGWVSVENPPYCLVFQDDFSNGINETDWNYETEIGGFGTDSFDWTTRDEKNVYTDEMGLHIVPTITTEAINLTLEQITNGYTLNLTAEGVCSSTDVLDCVRVSNSTTGVVINPVRSARSTTKAKHNITYGKVEVVAKMPKGSWLWPAIWMMPEANAYGLWPASGEIDIVESKGNDGSMYDTMGVRYLRRTDYSEAYHVFGMEWSENYIYTWVDTRIQHTMFIKFGKKQGMMFERGKFAGMNANGSVSVDPWSQTGRYNTPFDDAFYLILNVAVGSTNGYFKDGYANKP